MIEDHFELVYQFSAHLEKVCNVNYYKLESGQEWFWQGLTYLHYSPWRETWHRWISRVFKHVYQIWAQLETLDSAKLFKLGNGQRWNWGALMNFPCLASHETWQDDQICHRWHAGIFLELMEKLPFVNISKAWNIQKGFLRGLANILNMTMYWNSYIWTIYVPWVYLIFLKYFWNIKIIFPYERPFLALRKSL